MSVDKVGRFILAYPPIMAAQAEETSSHFYAGIHCSRNMGNFLPSTLPTPLSRSFNPSTISPHILSCEWAERLRVSIMPGWFQDEMKDIAHAKSIIPIKTTATPGLTYIHNAQVQDAVV